MLSWTKRERPLRRMYREPAHAHALVAKCAACTLLLWLVLIGASGGNEREANGLRLVATLIERHSRIVFASQRRHSPQLSETAGIRNRVSTPALGVH